MEKLKKKHDHKLTHLLKAFIFSIVMLAPLLAVGSKLLYLWNPNAKDSYYGQEINNYEDKYINNENFKTDELYYYNSSNENINVNNVIWYLTIKEITFVQNDSITQTLKSRIADIDNIYFFVSGTTQYIQFRDSNNVSINGNVALTYNIDFTYYQRSFNVNNSTLITFIKTHSFYRVYNKNSYLDNAFYYAIDQLDTEPLFNWTKETAIYTIIDEMTTGLEIGTNTLSILLTYWALNTAIYIVFDIIIEMFVKMTHIIS